MNYGGISGALLKDFPKVFDCIARDLFIAKLEAYGFQSDTLNIVYDYFSNESKE